MRSVLRAAVLCLLPFVAVSVTADSCTECHKSEDFYARFPRLYEYYRDWVASSHAEAGVSCADCHGGQPEEAEKEAAHRGIFPVNNPESSLHFSRQPATCGECHSEKQEEFSHSKHFRALQSKELVAPTCTTCHPAMNKRPGYQSIILDACASCHGEGNRQGLPPVVDDAENVLRSINVAKGMLGWASLHFGSHDWPGDSRQVIRDLELRYSDIVDQVHRFDLEDSGDSVRALLLDLRTLFETERRSGVSNSAADH